MRRRTKWTPLAAVVAGAWALGCSTGAKPAGMTPGGPVEPAMLEAADLAHVPTLTLRTTGGRATNPLHTSQISNGAFTEALVAEIFRSGAFRPVYDAVADYHLHVDLAEIEQPYWGWLDMEVRIGADWRLYEVASGALVWERRVVSAYTATERDSQWGIRRLRLANEGSARHNIVEGVAALARVAPAAP
jgi:hypothetical protein